MVCSEHRNTAKTKIQNIKHTPNHQIRGSVEDTDHRVVVSLGSDSNIVIRSHDDGQSTLFIRCTNGWWQSSKRTDFTNKKAWNPFCVFSGWEWTDWESLIGCDIVVQWVRNECDASSFSMRWDGLTASYLSTKNANEMSSESIPDTFRWSRKVDFIAGSEIALPWSCWLKGNAFVSEETVF